MIFYLWSGLAITAAANLKSADQTGIPFAEMLPPFLTLHVENALIALDAAHLWYKPTSQPAAQPGVCPPRSPAPPW